MRQLHYKTIVYEVPRSAVTVFFINSFKTPGRLFAPFYRALNRMGFTVYVYSYRSQPLLYATPQQWLDFSGSIAGDIGRQIRRMRSSDPGVRFSIIGVSVGSVMALHAAKLNQELERVILVSVYGSNARQTWEHPSLGYMREYFETRGISPEEASEAFGLLEPTRDVQLLGSRPLLIFASETDRVIRFSNTQLLLEKARILNLDCTVQMVKARRHSVANIKGLMSDRIWRPFLTPLLDDASHQRAAVSNAQEAGGA